jgi:hypothetical protein
MIQWYQCEICGSRLIDHWIMSFGIRCTCQSCKHEWSELNASTFQNTGVGGS